MTYPQLVKKLEKITIECANDKENKQKAVLKKRIEMLEGIVGEPYCFPGGYEKVAVIVDGGVLCADCIKKNKERIMSDIEDGYDTGWLIDAVCLSTGVTGGDTEEQSQDDCFCDNCNKLLGELFS